MLNFKTNPWNRGLVGLLIGALLFTTLCNPLSVAATRAQENCETALADAQDKYINGRFDEAIDILERCLTKGFNEEQKKQAYKFLGLSYLAKDYLDQAKNAIKKLLELVPNWEPDPIQDPPPFKKLVEEVKEQMAKEKQVAQPEPVQPVEPPPPTKKGGGKKFIFIGGASAAAAAVTVLFLLGGDGPQRLPDPPPLPQ
jgi:tetratricopeptide (TPR) repeat protein